MPPHNMLKKLADHRDSESLSSKFRRKRFEFFRTLVDPLPRPVRILDVGGTESFWEMHGFHSEPGFEIILVNRQQLPVSNPNISSRACDAANMDIFSDGEFDIVFSNSMIEHIADPASRKAAADEIRRVGNRYFVQTPNRYFPVEPHFLFPFFQFLPGSLKVWLLCNFRVGNYDRFPNTQSAQRKIDSISLLSERDLRDLFPDATIEKETYFGLCKSFMAYRWD